MFKMTFYITPFEVQGTKNIKSSLASEGTHFTDCRRKLWTTFLVSTDIWCLGCMIKKDIVPKSIQLKSCYFSFLVNLCFDSLLKVTLIQI